MNSLRNSSRSLASTHRSVVSTKSSVLSVASTQRKQNRKEFSKCYLDVCHMQHTNPLQAVKQNLEHGALDFTADRIKFEEWTPIITALRSDQTLHRVAIRLRQRVATPILTADTDVKARNVVNQPVIATKFCLYWLLEALKTCLLQSTALAVLEIEGLPLKSEFLAILAQGIIETKSLQHLSLIKCGIGDEGVEVISMAIRNAPTIISLDFSFCDLTEIGARSVSKLITLQKLNRYSEAWKQTLRYRDPDIEAMPGLRRLTLNHNPDIGDRGVQQLANEARDDLWLRAIDLQNTGMGDDGASHLVHLVRNNPNLSIVDARNNPQVSNEILSEIMAVLAINNADKTETGYKWLNCHNATKTNEKECKKTTSRSSVLRPWPNSPKMRKQSSFHLGGVLPSRTIKNFQNNHKIQEDLITKENQNLRQQIVELNQILNNEIKQKAEILRENHYLKDALQEAQLEIREMEEQSSKKRYISEEALEEIEKILTRLIGEQDAPETITNIPELLGSIFQSSNSKTHQQVDNVIWEEEEPASERSLPPPKPQELNGTAKAKIILQAMLNKKSN